MNGKEEQNKHYFTSVSEIWIDADAIMHIKFSKDIELSLDDMKEAYALFEELGFGPGKKKSRQLLCGGPFSISKQARDYAGKNATDYFVAAAMVTNSPFMKFVVNLFNKVQKHNVPFKIFTKEKDALTWLKKYSNQ